MDKVVLAFDPGSVSGAFAIITSAREVLKCANLPMLKDKIDYLGLTDTLKSYEIVYASMEDVHAAPKQGVSSTFNFGYATGMLTGILVGLGIPVLKLRPSVWKAILNIRSKDDSLMRAKELFPKYDGIRLKKDHNKAEALLMAHLALKAIE